MKCTSKLTIAIAAAVLAGLDGQAFAQDKYSLKSPGGIAFSDFKGYEDWSVISSARTDKELKVIVGNPTMIKAYKAGVPGNGKPFPEGSKIAKLQWSPRRARRPRSSSTCRTLLRRLSSWRRTASAFQPPAAGDTRCSIMTMRLTSSRRTRQRPTAATSCHVAVKARTTSSTRTRSAKSFASTSA